mmetsp:Transcript_29462/g.91085  ORF Transcript_29462/g.91085 Transcript_29462/m.91085 type:complete len:265 (+) Transcript_29462:438-1232(+)
MAAVTSAGRSRSSVCKRAGENGRRAAYTKLSMGNRECARSCEWSCVGSVHVASAHGAAAWSCDECECSDVSALACDACECSAFSAWSCEEREWSAAAATAALCSSTGPTRAAPSSPATPSTSVRSASPYSQVRIDAPGFRAPTTCCRRDSSPSSTRSALFNNKTSAHSTCSTSKSQTERCKDPSKRAMRNAAGSCSPFAARSGRFEMASVSAYAERNALASTTVTSVSSSTSSSNGTPAACASWNWSRIARGSAMPVASMTMCE